MNAQNLPHSDFVTLRLCLHRNILLLYLIFSTRRCARLPMNPIPKQCKQNIVENAKRYLHISRGVFRLSPHRSNAFVARWMYYYYYDVRAGAAESQIMVRGVATCVHLLLAACARYCSLLCCLRFCCVHTGANEILHSTRMHCLARSLYLSQSLSLSFTLCLSLSFCLSIWLCLCRCLLRAFVVMLFKDSTSGFIFWWL